MIMSTLTFVAEMALALVAGVTAGVGMLALAALLSALGLGAYLVIEGTSSATA